MDSLHNTQEQLLLTRFEAGRRLSLSLRSIDQLLADGQLPCVRFSRRCVRIPADGLKDYVQQLQTGGLQR